MRTVGRIKRQDEANSRFSQSGERAYKQELDNKIKNRWRNHEFNDLLAANFYNRVFSKRYSLFYDTRLSAFNNIMGKCTSVHK